MICPSPLVTVVIPCYDVERYVRDAVESVAEQTYPKLELVCVDDGSTDGTLPLLHQLQEQHGATLPFTVLTGPNSGAPSARNKGLKKAEGEWIQFLDADDLLLPEKIEHQMRLIQKAPSAPDFVAAPTAVIKENGEKHTATVHPDDDWVALLKSRIGHTGSNLWKYSALQRIGGWKESMPNNQERDLMFRLLASGARVLYDSRPLAVHRRRKGSISSKNLRLRWEVSLEVRKNILKHLDSIDALTPERRSVANRWNFRRLRSLSALDYDAAVHYYDELIPGDFTPQANSAKDRVYGAMYRALGFRTTEYMLNTARSVARVWRAGS